jgi:hypothetical protein
LKNLNVGDWPLVCLLGLGHVYFGLGGEFIFSLLIYYSMKMGESQILGEILLRFEKFISWIFVSRA